MKSQSVYRESEYSTFNPGGFVNTQNGKFIKPIINDYSPTNAVSMSVSKVFDKEDTPEVKTRERNIVYVKTYTDEELPPKDGEYITDLGKLLYWKEEWFDKTFQYSDIEWWLKAKSIKKN